jgi:Bacterial Ig-like domain (group 3)/FG-GAP-like repeat
MRILSTAIVAALLLSSTPLEATCTFGFLSHTEYPANSKPGDVTTGDFNNDGYVDVVVQNRTMLQVSILLGLAGGGFGAPTAIPTEYAQSDIQAAHFNADGNLDLVLSIPWSNNFTVYPYLKVLLGNGNGGFTAVPYTSQQLVYQNPTAIALGDFNKDGKMDAATAKNDGQFSSMQNLGGRLVQVAEYDTPGSLAMGIAAGDFDGDGHTDIALAETILKKVYFYYGVGDGTFTAGTTPLDLPHANRGPVDVEAGDFNGDGKDDVAVLIQNSSTSVDHGPLKIALSNGVARTFGTAADFGELPFAYELLVRDMDGDGHRDVVLAASSALAVFRGNGDGTFDAIETFESGLVSALGLAIDDFDRDGGPDVVTTMFSAGKIAVFLNACGRVGLSLTSSANPAAQGTPITITGTVIAPPTGAVAPTGTLTLKRSTTMLNSGNLTGGLSVQATMNDLTPATYAISAEYSGDSRFVPATATLQQVVTVPPFGPPPGLNAISFGGPVQLAWLATLDTDHYEVWRNNGAGWGFVGNAPGASFTDNGAPSSAALLYKVRAIAAGGTASEFSAVELALTYAFTDGTLTAGVTPVKLAHLTELRNAANAVRAVASHGAMTWAEPSPQIIRASHLTELRTAIAAARTSLGLSAVTYTDPSLTAGILVKAVHFEELRAAMR